MIFVVLFIMSPSKAAFYLLVFFIASNFANCHCFEHFSSFVKDLIISRSFALNKFSAIIRFGHFYRSDSDLERVKVENLPISFVPYDKVELLENLCEPQTLVITEEKIDLHNLKKRKLFELSY